MSSESMLLSAALTFAVLLCIEIYKAAQNKPHKSTAPSSVGPNEDVRVVELSDTLRVHIFQRPGGSFGYYYTRLVRGDDEFDYTGAPSWSNLGGPNSVYDTAERAEEYARQEAPGET